MLNTNRLISEVYFLILKGKKIFVSRNLEDFITWVDTSAIRKHVLEYNNIVSLNTHIIIYASS